MVTSLEPLASMAGMRVLQQGGNAFDAAVATAIALTVVDQRMSSVGGNGFATIYVAKTHEVHALNFYGSAPQHATLDVYKGKDYSHGFLSVPVPSCLKGYEALHNAYGRLPWARVLEPAIELAEDGFVLTQPLGEFIPISGRVLKVPLNRKGLSSEWTIPQNRRYLSPTRSRANVEGCR
jgi:gamma-glutamyltranspeptidase/glutathione hydrolase